MRLTSFLPFGCLGGNLSLDRAPIHIYIYIIESYLIVYKY